MRSLKPKGASDEKPDALVIVEEAPLTAEEVDAAIKEVGGVRIKASHIKAMEKIGAKFDGAAAYRVIQGGVVMSRELITQFSERVFQKLMENDVPLETLLEAAKVMAPVQKQITDSHRLSKEVVDSQRIGVPKIPPPPIQTAESFPTGTVMATQVNIHMPAGTSVLEG